MSAAWPYVEWLVMLDSFLDRELQIIGAEQYECSIVLGSRWVLRLYNSDEPMRGGSGMLDSFWIESSRPVTTSVSM
jgi:hypothetical protein